MSSVQSALVIGGAGIFGSEICAGLTTAGAKVVVFDSLVTGDGARATAGPLVKADAREHARITRSLNEYQSQRVYLCCLQEPKAETSEADLWERHLTVLMATLQALRSSTCRELVVFLPTCQTTERISGLLIDCSKAMGFDLKMISWDVPVAQAVQQSLTACEVVP